MIKGEFIRGWVVGGERYGVSGVGGGAGAKGVDGVSSVQGVL